MPNSLRMNLTWPPHLLCLPFSPYPFGSCPSPQCHARSATLSAPTHNPRQPGSAFDIAGILRHHVVEVFARSQLAASSDGAVPLQLGDSRRVGAVLIHVDPPR